MPQTFRSIPVPSLVLSLPSSLVSSLLCELMVPLCGIDNFWFILLIHPSNLLLPVKIPWQTTHFPAPPLFYIIPSIRYDFLPVYHSSIVEAGYNCRSSQTIVRELCVFDKESDAGLGCSPLDTGGTWLWKRQTYNSTERNLSRRIRGS